MKTLSSSACAVVCSAVFCAFNCWAGPGALDLTFNTTVNGPVYTTTVLPNGRILIGGNFTQVNGVSRGRIARLNNDGSLDLTFLNNSGGASASVLATLIQPDGRILIGGIFSAVNYQSHYLLARLNVDGSTDGTFNSPTSYYGSVHAIALQADGKIVAGGSFTLADYPPTYRYVNLVRFNADGSLDRTLTTNLTFNATINALAVQSDGGIIVGGNFTSVGFGVGRGYLVRLESDGVPDVSFGAVPNGPVYAIVLQPDGKILLGGNFSSINNATRNRIARLNSDGNVDATFNNAASGANTTVYAIALQANADVVLCGSFVNYNGLSRNGVARAFPDGTVDTAFFNGQIGTISQPIDSCAIQSDGKVIVGGEFTAFNNVTKPYLARLYGDLYPPEIITQPQSKSTNVGAAVTFTVNLSNPTPVSYQWRKNGFDIPGATLDSYPLSNLQLADSGSYTVFVNNSAGGTSSSNAVLAVGIKPVITNQPASLVVTQGQSATFTVGASGTPLSYQWRAYNVPSIPGATNSSFTIQSASPTNSIFYYVVVSNFLGSVTSQFASLQVVSPPVITREPVSQTVGEGTPVSFSISATGTSLRYQWYKDGVALSQFSSVYIDSAQLTDAGSYFVVASNFLGTATSQVATLAVERYPVAIVTQPTGQNAAVGSTAEFFVEATGTTLHYQWFKDGQAISDSTDYILHRTNVSFADAGSYTVTVSNPLNVLTSAVAVLNVGYPPIITNQPVSVTNAVGDTGVFAAGVDGTQPIQLLWLFNGNPMPDQTNATLTITNVQTANIGIYALTATNVFGGTVSSNAALTLHTSPIVATFDGQTRTLFISGPANATCVVEQTFNLSDPVDWRALSTNVVSDVGTWTFVDTNVLEQQQIYYRVTLKQ